jgi:hypothetical protein
MRRWLVIRHIRYFYHRFWINQNLEHWLRVGVYPSHTGKYRAVLDRIWRGEL